MNPTPAVSWQALDPSQALARLDSAPAGLSENEARRRLVRLGPNRIRETERSHPVRILLHQFRGALVYVLLAAMLLSLVIGHWEDAVVIGVVLLLNAGVGFLQEYRAENAIASLMDLVSPRASVEREGVRREIVSEQLVPGDIVWLQSGDLVPADLRLLSASSLEVSEALLTGESLPVAKTADRLENAARLPIAERRNLAFMGTSVASGRARGLVVTTGAATEIGGIAREIRGAERVPTPLQGRMDRFGRRVSLAILALAALTFAVGLARGEMPATMFLTAVAVAVSAVPEGLPVVMTIVLAVSVRRMARRRAIVRRLPAVETLGSCTVIVTDKTGTLTENRMTVQEIALPERRLQVTGSGLEPTGEFVADGRPAIVSADPALQQLLLAGVLCNEAELDPSGSAAGGRGDPTELALLVAAAKAGLEASPCRMLFPEREAIPFESERQWAAAVHEGPEGPVLFVKGAPERVVAMCAHELGPGGPRPLAPDAWRSEAARMGGVGLRVLALASHSGESASRGLHGEEPSGLVLLGLVGMLDPPRPETPAALRACRRAGIRVLMVTGDHARTALAVAERVGLDIGAGRVVGGAELAALDDAALAEVLAEVSVFARVSPADKLRIVQLLTARGEVVAVTGDGVNDAPALKSAHVGVAMGRSGTDVAREASEVVLSDDDFASIAAAVEEGRTAFSNLRKATFFLVSSGVGELLAILGSLALRLPLPLLPAQILWLNVVTNGVEDVGLAVEPAERGELERPPRDPHEGVLTRRLVERVLLSGAVMALGTLGIFFVEWGGDAARLDGARVAALTTLVAFQVFHVVNARSSRRSVLKMNPFSNRVLLLGVTASALLHVGALYWGPTQRLLGVAPLTAETWLRIVCVAVTIIAVVELHKLLRPAEAVGVEALP